jgi:gag-polypeptide of LTR copia-type
LCFLSDKETTASNIIFIGSPSHISHITTGYEPMSDRNNDDRIRLQVFNSSASRSAGSDSYTVWRTRLLIALRARRLLSVVANVEDEDDNEDEAPSLESRQACATQIITAALGPVPFMAVQSLINDPAAILRRLDEKYQGNDTTSVMATVSEVATKRYTSGKSMGMYVAEFESLSMRMEAVGHPVSEALLVANFINSLSNATVLHAVISALRATEDLTWTKVSTQVLHEAELKGLNGKGRIYDHEEIVMAASSGFDGECGEYFHCVEYGNRASAHSDESSRNFTRSQGGIGERRSRTTSSQ